MHRHQRLRADVGSDRPGVSRPGPAPARPRPGATPGPVTPIILAGGGTGGHTSPALAVAALLRRRNVAHAWIGSRDGLEAHRAAEQAIPYFAIPTGKLRRYWAWRNVTDLALNVPAGVVRAHG
ncbi:MAG: hypothetical protein E6K30_12410, partial [Gammaproteobacteria bacterium]